MRDEILAPYPRKPEEVKTHIAEYYGMISHLDNEIGKVMESVEKKGLMDNTLFIFAGDNGLALGQHGLFGKQNHYEHSIRVPLIFAGPGIPAGEQRDTYAYLLDIYPTICEYLHIDKPKTVDGISLLPSIADEKKSHRKTLYFVYTDMLRSVKNEQYKLIEYASENCRKTQLFDLKNDPWENTNLYGKEEYADMVNALRCELFRYCNEWEDKNHPMGKLFWERYTSLPVYS